MREPHRRIRPRPLRRRIEQAAGRKVALRPSVLSVDRVDVGRRQSRMLLERLRHRIGRAPTPRVVVYGESLGALAGHGAFEGLAAAGPSELGVDRTLWAGTPQFGRW